MIDRVYYRVKLDADTFVYTPGMSGQPKGITDIPTKVSYDTTDGITLETQETWTFDDGQSVQVSAEREIPIKAGEGASIDVSEDGSFIIIKLDESEKSIQSGSGVNAIQMKADPSKNGHLAFPDDTIYAKILDPTLSLDNEPIGALGDYSAMFGGNGQAKGKRTFAAGTTTLAKGNYSAVFGDNTVTLQHGTDGMAQGYQTVIDAPASHSEGAYTVVMNQKYVEGMFDPNGQPGQPGQPTEPGTTPTDTLQMDARRGEAGHATGFNSYVSGFAAYTDGVSNVADGHISKASGRSNRAWSYLSKVDGYQSVVKPDDIDTNATAEGSWANGYDIQLVGAKYAYAGGMSGRVSKDADYSFSYGLGLAAQGKAQAIFGQYNSGDDVSVFIIGNGASDTQRNTAFRVLKNGQVLVSSAPTNPQGVIRLAEYNTLNDKIAANITEIANLWSTIRETNSNLVKVDNNSYKKTGGAITGDVQVTGTLQVQTAPTNPDGVVRKLELDTKYDKAGGTIGGNVIITGDLTVNGTRHINNTENLAIKNAMIYSNSDGATLATNGGIGIKKNAIDIYGIAYDPTSDSVKLGLGKSDSNGNFTFNADEGEPVAIRDDSSKFIDGHLVQWDSTNKKLIDSGYLLEDFAKLDGSNTFALTVFSKNAFEGESLRSQWTDADNTIRNRIQIAAKNNDRNFPGSQITIEEIDTTAGSKLVTVYQRGSIKELEFDGVTTWNSGNGNLKTSYEWMFPKKSGTFALLEDVTGSGTTFSVEVW